MLNAIACSLALGRGGSPRAERAGATLRGEGAEPGSGTEDGSAEAGAERNHWRGVIAVADDRGWLIVLERMNHAAMTASVELAAGKARSVAPFKKRLTWTHSRTETAARPHFLAQGPDQHGIFAQTLDENGARTFQCSGRIDYPLVRFDILACHLLRALIGTCQKRLCQRLEARFARDLRLRPPLWTIGQVEILEPRLALFTPCRSPGAHVVKFGLVQCGRR